MENTVGKRISHLLSEYGMSQKSLADLAGVTEAAISHYLKGDREPRGAILLNIANALHTTTDYLLGINNDSSTTEKNSIASLYNLIARNKEQLTSDEKIKIIKMLTSED